MRTALIVALMAGVLGAPAPEPKKISVELKDVTLAALAKAVSEQAGVEVRVAEEVADKRVTVVLEKVTAEAVLKQAAESLGTPLAVNEDGSFDIGPVKPPITDKIRKILVETKLNLNFQGTSLVDALGFYSSMTTVAMVVDPEVLAKRKPGTLEMNLAVEGLSAENCLDLTAELLGLKWDIRWGLVFLSTKERLAALPTYALPPSPTGERPEGEKALQLRLARETIAFDFMETPLPSVIEFISKVRNLPIRWDEAARKAAETTVLSLKLTGVTLDKVLAVALYTHGLEYEVTKDAVVIRSMKR